MSCNNCSTDTNSIPKGCKSNGDCDTGSCDKLTVFDWLSNMALPPGQSKFDIVEVRFKNGRKHFFKNRFSPCDSGLRCDRLLADFSKTCKAVVKR